MKAGSDISDIGNSAYNRVMEFFFFQYPKFIFLIWEIHFWISEIHFRISENFFRISENKLNFS